MITLPVEPRENFDTFTVRSRIAAVAHRVRSTPTVDVLIHFSETEHKKALKKGRCLTTTQEEEFRHF